MVLKRAQTPFLFKTQFSLVEMTGQEASDLTELSCYLKVAAECSIYYHTHHFLQAHQFLTPEPPNDFAYWVANVLQEERIGEKLAAIDTVRFGSLDTLRTAIVAVIDTFLAEHRPLRKAPLGEEFHFLRCILFTLATPYVAHDLEEFLRCLKRVGTSCLYHHMFEGRLRLSSGTNDFSNWLSKELDEVDLAMKIARLDPYTHTLEGLRRRIVGFVEKRLSETYDAKT